MYARKSIRQYRHTLSDREAKILSSLSYRGRIIFTADDLKEIIIKELVDESLRMH